MEAAVVALEGDALLWFQWENGRREVRSWEEFKGLVLWQFRPTAAGTLHEQNHKQLTGGVAEYRRKFIELLASLSGIPKEIAKVQFILGLSEDIRAEVRLLGPRSLDMVMDLAIKAEDKVKWARFKHPASSYVETYPQPKTYPTPSNTHSRSGSA